MSKRTRRQYTIEQKVAILRRHLVDKVPVSDLCNEYKLQPSVFYQWMKQAMENIGAALAPRPPRPDSREKQLAGQGRAAPGQGGQEGRSDRRDLGRVRATKKRTSRSSFASPA